MRANVGFDPKKMAKVKVLRGAPGEPFLQGVLLASE
jgi:hypothetical protein